MKVLILRTTPNIVDIQTYNIQEIGLAKALVRKGHKCDVALYSGQKSDYIQTLIFDDGKAIKIIWLHGFGFAYEGIYPSLKKYIDYYDIVQVGGYVGLTSCWLNLFASKKVVNYNGLYYCKENKGDLLKAKIWDNTLLYIQDRKKMMVACKSKLATEYIKSKGIESVFTVGVGLDLDNLNNINANENSFINEIRQKKGNLRYLLYVGKLEERRNIIFLIDIFNEICSKRDDYRFVIVGKGDYKYLKKCEEKINQFNLKNKIYYIDYIEQKYMSYLYETVDAFLLPTRYEIFGMVLLEAMYYGVPVFTTYNGGSSTIINSSNGVIINNYFKDEWSNKITNLIENNNERIKMSNDAHKTIVEGYTWDVLVDKFLDVYKRRLNNKQ